jgi:predicted flap endonuclease-1-like 5' DNA nuclease
MNLDWTSLVIGLIIGWLLEWIIDWLYWRKGGDAPDLTELQAELELAKSNATDLETALSVSRGEVTLWENKYAELEAECIDANELRGQIDALNARINAGRLGYIEDLTRLDGIDEETALLLIDAGYLSRADLADADPADIRLILGQDEDEFNGWWGGLALAGLGIAAAAGDDDVTADIDAGDRMGMAFGASDDLDVDVDHEPVGMAFGADAELDAELEEDREDLEVVLAAAAVIDEELDLIDVDGDGEVDVVVDTEVTGLDLDRSGDIDVVLDESLDAVIFESVAPDDLTRVQGIGPAYAKKLNAAGIFSFAALAALNDDELDAILEPKSFQKMDYNIWRLHAGTLAEMPALAMEGDNLQRIEGIGPTYSRLLVEGGITTFAELAAATPDELAEIIKAPGWRNVDYASWIAQARLAAAGDEEGLQALQDQLNNRSGDNLLLIHGVGQNYYDALVGAGITSYADLSTRSPETLAAIMSDAGLRTADYEAWIEEARLRASGKRVPRATRSYADEIVVSCPQDLDPIEGIGTVFEQRLYAAGIGSYWEVAQLTDEQLTEILGETHFKNANPAEIRASAMRLAVETNTVNRVWNGTEPDDFEVFEGIGVIYERRLYNAGYCTYEALAAATIEALIAACQPPKGQSPDFAGWIATAQILAAAKGVNNE